MFLDILGRAAEQKASLEEIWSRGDSLSPPGLASGIPIDERSAMRVSAVWACVRLLASSVAMLPLHVYRVRRDGSRDRVPNHPVETLFDEGFAACAGDYLRQTMQGHVLLAGNAYALIERNRGVVSKLTLLDPTLTRPRRLNDGEVAYELSGGGIELIPGREVFHLPGIGWDGLQGYRVVAVVRELFDLALAMQKYGVSLWGNNARPSGVLEVPKSLGDAAFERLRADWERLYGGTNNAGRTAILEEGATFKPISIPPEDAQYLDSKRFSVEDIARMFGVPPWLVGAVDKTTSWGSGVEQQGLAFVTYSLGPWLRRWDVEIRRKLFTRREIEEGFFAEHVTAALLRGDTKGRFESYALGRTWGWLSTNDVRKLENLTPIPGGDDYLIPANMRERNELDEAENNEEEA